jgi:hypothetical protein
MIPIALAVVWAGYTVGVWGYCLIRGYDVSFVQVLKSTQTWQGGPGGAGSAPAKPAKSAGIPPNVSNNPAIPYLPAPPPNVSNNPGVPYIPGIGG